MILLVDNFDSFTYNLVDYFEQLGQKVYVVRNNITPNSLDWSQFSHMVLSPGPESPAKANYLLDYLEKGASNKLPIFGVCLGHQAINVFFGGTLKKGSQPMHGKISSVQHNKDTLFKDISTPLNVVRYHSLEIDKLGDNLKVICLGPNKEIMGIKHKKEQIYSVQFHPESVLTDFGLKIFSNWLKISV